MSFVPPHSVERVYTIHRLSGFGSDCGGDPENTPHKRLPGGSNPGRKELFERERGGDPDFRGWDGCVRACGGGLRRVHMTEWY